MVDMAIRKSEHCKFWYDKYTHFPQCPTIVNGILKVYSNYVIFSGTISTLRVNLWHNQNKLLSIFTSIFFFHASHFLYAFGATIYSPTRSSVVVPNPIGRAWFAFRVM